MISFGFHDHTYDPMSNKKARIKTAQNEKRVVRIVVSLNDTEVLGHHRVGYDDQLRDYWGLAPLPRARIY